LAAASLWPAEARNDLQTTNSAYDAMPKLLPPLIGASFAVTLMLALAGRGSAADEPFDWSPGQILPPNLDLCLPVSDATQATPRPDRIRLFRIVPGFLSDPVGLEDDTPHDPDGLPVKADDGPSWLQVAMGNDNPYFDVRQPGDPGGIGYTRVNTQLQVVDLPSTGCTVGFQAVTPTGAQQGGIEDGPTVVSPAFSLFHALEDGTAFQGFVSKDLHVSNPANFTDTITHSTQLNRDVQYGVAVQRPVLPDLNNLYVFVEAIGRYRYDLTTPGTSSMPPAMMEVLPGMHLKVTDSWWLSGGVILPVSQYRTTDNLLWQLTCSFQF
jgi:hypothetical protein